MLRPELDRVHDLIQSLRADELFSIIGDLETLKAIAYSRVFVPSAVPVALPDSDRLSRIEQSIVKLSDSGMSDEMLTEDEAARMRRKSKHALRKERGRGAGPRWIRDGRRVLYPKTDLLEWLREREHETGDSRRKPRFAGEV